MSTPCANEATHSRVESETMSVAIVGASGYIGSALHDHLMKRGYVNVLGFDRNPRAVKFENVVHCPIHVVDDETIQKFDVVIYLGGATGRKVCDARQPHEIERENVQDVLQLASRMTAAQLLIVASTSAIAQGSGATRHAFLETDEPNIESMDSYTHSLFRRENALNAFAAQPNYEGPKLVALRFGTVVGVSPSQRTEFVHVAMVRSALMEGRISVWHPETWRPFLWIQDQVGVFEELLKQKHFFWKGENVGRLHIYHTSSFNSTVGQAANEVVQVLGASQTVMEHDPADDNFGFLLNSDKLARDFGVKFGGTPQRVVKDLVLHGDHVLVGREALDHEKHVTDYVLCCVCNSSDMMEVLDLGDQPLANDFRPTMDDSVGCKRYPLRLMRCRQCGHAQLSNMIDRNLLFDNYSYRSDTSKTLNEYFHWFAEKVDAECVGHTSDGAKKRVLELACNDGTQLNHFRELGWETYGVDPATNLVPYARAQNHVVWNEMWGVGNGIDYTGMPETFDAIVGQNVLAHVTNPVDFLAACVERMNDTTRLYVQTSQFEMFADGQFDTVYHEHISFFSPRSFNELALRVGLKVVRIEITPIHGGSGLVTMMKTDKEADDTLSRAMQLESDRGQLHDAYFIRYRSRAKATRDWLNGVLEEMFVQGHDVVGYGAAAKGMVLLHFMLAQNPAFEIKYVVDDAPLKQNTYCPGTSIPVKPASELSRHDATRPLCIIVFPWNFWSEIRKRIVEALRTSKHEAVWIVLPYPRQEVLVLRGQDLEEMVLLQTNPYRPPDPLELVSGERRGPTVGLVTHFYNEGFLLPYFIRHHAGLFDEVVMLDCGSTDDSRQIIADNAPSNWRVVDSKYPDVFDALALDAEVVEHEKTLCTSWRIALTTTEFIVHPDLRGELLGFENNPNVRAIRYETFMMAGDDTKALERFPHLIVQRTQVTKDSWINKFNRYMHRLPLDHNYYHTGRHELNVQWSAIVPGEKGFLAKWKYTPWPESVARKLQIGFRIPPDHLREGWGFHHAFNASELEEVRKKDMESHGLEDLRYIGGMNGDEKWVRFSQAWCQVSNKCPIYN